VKAVSLGLTRTQISHYSKITFIRIGSFMDHMWDDSWWEKQKYVHGNLPQCHLVHESDPLRENIPVIWARQTHIISNTKTCVYSRIKRIMHVWISDTQKSSDTSSINSFWVVNILKHSSVISTENMSAATASTLIAFYFFTAAVRQC
jgi:hypothetical protein